MESSNQSWVVAVSLGGLVHDELGGDLQSCPEIESIITMTREGAARRGDEGAVVH